MDEIAAQAREQANAEVWVAETWRAHGYGRSVQGVYDSREAAFDGLKGEPGMTVWVDAAGSVRGRPRNEERVCAAWALAKPHRIQVRP